MPSRDDPIHTSMSVRSTREKKTDNKLTELVL